MKNNLLKEKKALITGGSMGIGKAIAEELALRGCDLVLIARKIEELKIVKKEFEEKYNVKVYFYSIDLSDKKNLNKEFKKILDIHQIDILVNNAGVARNKPFKNSTIDEAEDIMNLNFFSPLFLIKKIYPQMIKKGEGRIINISSPVAFRPYKNMSLYSSSKAALASFSEVIRKEFFEFNIKVLLVFPGIINTAMYEKNKNNNDPESMAMRPLDPKIAGKKIISALVKGEEKLFIPKFIKYWFFFEKVFPRFSKKILLFLNKK